MNCFRYNARVLAQHPAEKHFGRFDTDEHRLALEACLAPPAGTPAGA